MMKCTDKKCNGLIMLVFGVLFFLGTLGVWAEFSFAKYWPLVLIVVGLHKLICCCRQKSMCCSKDGMGCGGPCDAPMKDSMPMKKK